MRRSQRKSLIRIENSMQKDLEMRQDEQREEWHQMRLEKAEVKSNKALQAAWSSLDFILRIEKH